MDEKYKMELSTLPKEHQEIAELIGIDAFFKLCHYYGGSSLYIPKEERLTRQIRDAKIKCEFNGGNYKEIGRKYNISERHVRRIVDKIPPKYQQLRMYEFLE